MMNSVGRWWLREPMKGFKNSKLRSTARIFCPIVFLLAVAGCKDVTHESTQQTPPSEPIYSHYQPPPSQAKKIPIARQIVITNAFVVGTNYSHLKGLSPEARSQQAPSGFVPGIGYYILGHYYTATNLANQIASADRVVVRYTGDILDTDTLPVTMLLSGDAAKQVVQAVSSSGRYSAAVNPGWYFPEGDLQFYKGTKHLASVRLMSLGFSEDDGSTSYTDYSGVLGTLDDTGRAAAKE